MGLPWDGVAVGRVSVRWDYFGVGLLWGWGCCGGGGSVGVGVLWDEVAMG